MRIEFGQHAFDRAGQQLFVFHRFDIALLDVAEHFGQRLDFGQWQWVARLALGDRGKVKPQQDARHHADADQTAAFQFAVHVSLQRIAPKTAFDIHPCISADSAARQA